jgi:hypothetical protein
MRNQSSGKGGGSVKLQAMKKAPTPKNISGHGPAAGSSAGKSTVAAVASQGAAPGPMAPDSVKGGHN